MSMEPLRAETWFRPGADVDKWMERILLILRNVKVERAYREQTDRSQHLHRLMQSLSLATDALFRVSRS